MAIRIESLSQIQEIGNNPNRTRRYIFFLSPPELWVGEGSREGHSTLLTASGRAKEEVVVAGFITYLNDLIDIDGNGSTNLDIGRKDPTPAIDFVNFLKA